MVELTQGKVAFIDDADWELVRQHNWYAHKQGNTYYAQTNIVRADGSSTNVAMHRLIMGNSCIGSDVDHINHNGLDNRKSTNLRICTQTENNMNWRKRANCTSDYKGTSWHKANAKWQALITIAGKKRYLGSFDNELDAAMAYNKAALEHFGQFACINQL
jgi:hypothetical protein